MGSTTGDDAGSFCLKWNDYASNISIAFRDLRRQNDFFDVTLLTKDGSVQAHKVILSACSEFFRDAFKRMQPPRSGVLPMSIFLRGVSLLELQSILEFMYQGEVNVTHDNLNEFLAVAEELQVKGLTNKEESKAPPSPPPLAAPSPKLVKTSSVKSAYSSPSQVITGSLKRSITPSTSKGLNSVKKVKQEEQISADLGASSSVYVDPSRHIKPDPEIILDDSEDPNADEDYEGYEGYYGEEDEDVGDEAMASDQGGQSESSQARFETADPNSHLIQLHDGRVRCDLCNKLFASRSSAVNHNARVHNVSEYIECCLCKKVTKNKLNFRNHILNSHHIKGKDIVQSYGKIVLPAHQQYE